MWKVLELTGQILADSGTNFDFGSLLGQIGIGALVASPFVYSWRVATKRIELLESRIEERDTQALQRERQLSDKALPLLADASRTLQETQRGMDMAIERSRRPAEREELDVTLRRLELVVDSLRDRGEGHAR